MKRYIFLLFTCFLWFSCVENIDLDIPGSSSKLVLFGTINPDQEIVLDLSTSTQVNSPVNITWPDNAEITLSGPVSGSAEIHHSFIYYPEQRKYLPTNRSIRAKEDQDYQLSVAIPDSDYQKITSFTKIPGKIQLDEHELTDYSYSNGVWTLNVHLKKQESVNPNGFFHLIPQMVISSFELDDHGDTTHIESEIIAPSNTFCQTNNAMDFRYTSDTNGIIADISNATGLDISLTCSFEYLSDESISKMYFLSLEMESLTEDLYQFYITTEKQQRAMRDPFLSPIKNFSNIDGGLGIFSGVSTSHYQMPIR